MTTTKHDFSGTYAYVTGAGGGIGHEIVCQLARAGSNVVAFDLKADPQNFPEGPGSVRYIQGDIRDLDALRASFSSLDETGLDYLVNAAGIILWEKEGSVVNIDMSVWEKTLQVNLMGALHATRLAVPLMMRKKKGALVHIASVVGIRSADNAMEDGPADAYQVSKAAVVSMSRGLAIAHGKNGIRSNTICPGAVWTPMTDGIYENPARITKMENRTPSHSIGRPADIAQACMYLLSDDAAFVTGTDLVVDGGLTAKLQ